MSKDIAEICQNITKNTALLKNTDKNLKKAEAKIESLKTELKKRKKESEEVLMLCQVKKAAATGEIKELSSKMHAIKSEVIEYKNKIKLLDVDIRSNQIQIRSLSSKLSKLELHETEEGPIALPILTGEEINAVSLTSVHIEIGEIKNQIKDMNPDLGAIAEFKRKEEMYKQKLKNFEGTVMERDHYRSHYDNFRKHRLEEFMKGFNIITLKVKELYQMLTLGGDAELELVDSIDPFSEGIEFSVRPLRKSWKSIRNLSGGEKTLSSLSLVFALHYYRTTPFFVMDEIDAALDFRNVSIIGSYIKDCTKNAQFIVISLRENMFMLADHLVGIYKTKNCTKNVHFSPPQEETNANRETVEAFDKIKTITPIPYNDKDSVKEELEEKRPLVSSPKDSFVHQENATPKEASISNSDKESIEGNKTAPVSAENENKIGIENISRSNQSRLKTPKRKIVEVGNDREWSEDDDFVHQENVTPKEASISNSDKESIEGNKIAPVSAENENKIGKENISRSNQSRLKTPKRKIVEVENDREWSEDDDFVISTPRTQKSFVLK
ncbi:structural maintenance of chromosomes protein 4 [Caerostris extrusa]|uniref:Structural maintenance of chromosomes protein 4 n=1 Tax=Caerostris extrusa TaxID=172846 RepID=A0AAV4Y3B6_CAEEX|nr:structural maintenance of chromosomes protein 4 [Caerostris extrusa]